MTCFLDNATQTWCLLNRRTATPASRLHIPLKVLELAWWWIEMEKSGKDFRWGENGRAGDFYSYIGGVKWAHWARVIWFECVGQKSVFALTLCSPWFSASWFFTEILRLAQMKEPVWTYMHILCSVHRFNIHPNANMEFERPSNTTAPIMTCWYCLSCCICSFQEWAWVFYPSHFALFT